AGRIEFSDILSIEHDGCAWCSARNAQTSHCQSSGSGMQQDVLVHYTTPWCVHRPRLRLKALRGQHELMRSGRFTNSPSAILPRNCCSIHAEDSLVPVCSNEN